MCLLAGTGERAAGADGLPADKTALYLVSTVKKGPDGLVYVMDQNNYYLRRIEADGTMQVVAGNSMHSGVVDGALPTDTGFLDPIDFAWRADGRNVIVSWHDARLSEIGLDGRMHIIAGKGIGDPTATSCNGTGDGGPAIDAGFCELVAVAIDAQGRIFLADDTAHQIRMIDTDDTVSTLAGTGTPGYSGDGGPAVAAQLDTPSAIALDGQGNLYIADTSNNVIRKLDMTTKIMTTVAGKQSGIGGFSGDGGPCLAAEMNRPGGVVVDTDGSLYVADSYNQRIRHVDLAGDVINTIAGTGQSGFTGNDGPALSAKMNHPQRLSITDSVLYIGDFLSSTARSIRLE